MQIDVIERGSTALRMLSFPATDHYPQSPLSAERPLQKAPNSAGIYCLFPLLHIEGSSLTMSVFDISK